VTNAIWFILHSVSQMHRTSMGCLRLTCSYKPMQCSKMLHKICFINVKKYSKSLRKLSGIFTETFRKFSSLFIPHSVSHMRRTPMGCLGLGEYVFDTAVQGACFESSGMWRCVSITAYTGTSKNVPDLCMIFRMFCTQSGTLIVVLDSLWAANTPNNLYWLFSLENLKL
jgi:hypothetical protein